MRRPRPCWRLSRRARAASWAMEMPPVWSMNSGMAGHFLADLDQALELRLVDHAAADLLRRNAGLLGQDAGGELLGRHFEREEADDGAVVARDRRAAGLGGSLSDCARARATLKAMLVASAVLPIEGRPARTIRSEGCRPPILPSSAVRAGGDAGQAAVALVGIAGHLDGGGQRGVEVEEALAVLVGLGQREQARLGLLDLLLGREVDRDCRRRR